MALCATGLLVSIGMVYDAEVTELRVAFGFTAVIFTICINVMALNYLRAKDETRIRRLMTAR